MKFHSISQGAWERIVKSSLKICSFARPASHPKVSLADKQSARKAFSAQTVNLADTAGLHVSHASVFHAKTVVVAL